LAAIIDSDKIKFLPIQCMGEGMLKLYAKFAENRLIGSEGIPVLVN